MLAQAQDPEYLATKRHFAQLFSKFSFPIYCFNLTKKNKERELTVSNEYCRAINERLNSELPKKFKIHWVHYDVKAKKKQEKGFPAGLFAHAKEALDQTGYFCVDNSPRSVEEQRIQI